MKGKKGLLQRICAILLSVLMVFAMMPETVFATGNVSDETGYVTVQADLEETDNCNWGAEKKTINCKSCGAQTIYDALEVSSECPYCGSNQVMEAKDENTIAPGGVVPFSVTSEMASDNQSKDPWNHRSPLN